MAGSGAIGKPGCISSPNHGSSSQTTCGESGRAAATASVIVARRERTAATATANAASAVMPALVSATPSVTGPTNCHFTGPRRPRAAAVDRNVRSAA